MTTVSPDVGSYEDIGTGDPVVLLHPSGLGPAVLHPFARRLADGHRVVVPHRRGFGGDTDRPPPASLEETYDDLAALLDALRLEDPLVVGISAGATVALGFARRHPGRVRVLAHEPLVGPLGGPLHDLVQARIRRLLARADQPRETSLFLSDLIGVRAWNRLRADVRDDVERCAAPTQAEAALFAGFALDATDLAAWAAAGSPSPVVVSVGADSPSARQELALAVAAAGVPTVSVPRCSHLPAVEAPTAFAALIAELADPGVRS